MRRLLLLPVLLTAGGIVLAAAGTAAAAPLQPDPNQPANGAGYEHARYLTPAWSPIQVPAPVVTESTDVTTVVAHPYLSRLVHEIVPVPAHTAVELRGAARVTLPGLAAGGGTLVVNPNGHCVFAGAGAAPTAGRALAPVRVDTPLFQLVIEPTVYR